MLGRGVEVHVEHDWARNGFSVWFYSRRGRSVYVSKHRGGDVWEDIEVEENALRGEPSFYLPAAAFEALIRAAEGHVHAQDATVKHLDDATTTRDRLLALIEKRGLR